MTEQAKSIPPKFVIPDEWRVRCDFYKMDANTRQKFMPLQNDFLRCFLNIEQVQFPLYLLSGWDLVEFIKPIEFNHSLVRELLKIVKEYSPQTRVCIKRDHFTQYEALITKDRQQKFDLIAQKNPEIFDNFVKDRYNLLSNTSQFTVKGTLEGETFFRITHAASEFVSKIPKTIDVVNFLVTAIGSEPHLYDHHAATAMLSGCIAYNSLQLAKRESKLTVQSALLHDLERNCTYLFKPIQTHCISTAGIKEIRELVAKGLKFHDSTIRVMEEYRERFTGLGFPGKKSGRQEEDIKNGISRMARIVSIACAFTEYLLKRQDKKPLTLSKIMELMGDRSTLGDFDSIIFQEFAKDVQAPKSRKKPTEEAEDQSDDLLFEFSGDMFLPE